MPTDFFRNRLDQMVDLRHPLVLLAKRLPWSQIEADLSPSFSRQNRVGKLSPEMDLFGTHDQLEARGPTSAGRDRLPMRLMASLLYLKHAFNLSDEAVVERWSENVVWQYFSGQEYYEPRLPCDATQVGRFRKAIGKTGVASLLKATIDCAVETKSIQKQAFERVIVDTTVQEKAIAHPVDSRLLEIARGKVVLAAKHVGIVLKQTYAKEGKTLRRKAGGYAHAKQFKRLRKTVKRQRTILGIVLREVERKLQTVVAHSALSVERLKTWLARAWRIHHQRPKDKNKLYALPAPEVECISKGKARKPYEFGVKAGLVVTHRSGLIVGAHTFAGNPYDGHTLHQQLEQTPTLLQDVGRTPKEVMVDLGYRGVDADNPDIRIIHRGKYKSLTRPQRRHLKRRQAIEPTIGHLKADHRMVRCHLHGALGEALHAVLCATGYNLCWLMRALLKKARKAFFGPQFMQIAYALMTTILICARNCIPHNEKMKLGFGCI